MIIVPAVRGFLGAAKQWGPRNSLVAKNGTGTVLFTGLTIPAGALVVLGVSDVSATSTLGTVTDSAGNAWSNTGWTDNAAGGASIFWSRLTNPLNAGTITVTSRSGAGTIAAGGMWATGPAAAPYDAAAFGTTGVTSAAPTCISGAPSAAGELFFGMWAAGAVARTVTNDPGWTSHGVVNPTAALYGLAVASRINTGTGALTYAPTLNTSGLCRLNIAAFHQ